MSTEDTKIISFDRETRLRNIDHAIQEHLDGIEKDIASARQRWLAIGDLLLEARQMWPADQDFGAWCDQRKWITQINRWYRQAAMRLAFSRTRVEQQLPLLATKAVAPDYLLDLLQQAIATFGGEPLPEIRAVAVITATDDQGDDSPQTPPPSPTNQALTPEPSCEKAPPVRTYNAPGAKNAAVTAWGEVGAQILNCFSDEKSRRSWNQLAGKRHGIQVAKFALDYFERTGIPIPTNAVVKSANARLVLPWLNSPFADEYDLTKAASFQKLKDSMEVIERACRPYFDTHGHDRANRCFDLFRREVMRPAERDHEVKVKALRERERKSVNVENHPSILVHGVELWPDGDLPEDLRLEYDAARWAYRVWFEHDNFFSRAQPDVLQRASFWYCHQAAINQLKFPAGAAVSHFWWRAGQAMKHHPEDRMKSFCQMSTVKYT